MSNADFLTLDVKTLLAFYDEDTEVKRHSNSIKTLAGEELGFALLIEYFRRSSVKAELLRRPCTTGKKKGYRLDGWIQATNESSGVTTYYQVEVKSWSMHGVGGDSTPLQLQASTDEVSSYKKRLWAQYWSNGQFTAPMLNKVLTAMKCPDPSAIVQPLACLWAAVHPEGKSEPFFSVELPNPVNFSSVLVFSMSSFLRGIVDREPTISLSLPLTAIRLRWLTAIFPSHAGGQPDLER